MADSRALLPWICLSLGGARDVNSPPRTARVLPRVLPEEAVAAVRLTAAVGRRHLEVALPAAAAGRMHPRAADLVVVVAQKHLAEHVVVRLGERSQILTAVQGEVLDRTRRVGLVEELMAAARTLTVAHPAVADQNQTEVPVEVEPPVAGHNQTVEGMGAAQKQGEGLVAARTRTEVQLAVLDQIQTVGLEAAAD